jgi:L-histidine Nalpha-methyltransferase / hercynylcysteine S-oxide synthase
MPAPTESPDVGRRQPHMSCKAAKRQEAPPTPGLPVDITDIRRAMVEFNLKEDILSMFNPTNGPRMLPTLLLYDAAGLQFFEHVGPLSFKPRLA